MKLVDTIIIVAALVTCCVLMGGCSHEPPEGKSSYNRTWKYTTAQEKMLYSRVQDKWRTSSMKYVREAIRTREQKPAQNAIPFCDIASTIIRSNDVSLNADEKRGRSDHKEFIAAKWDSIDPNWYRQLQSCASQGVSVTTPLIVTTVLPKTVKEAVNVNAQETSRLLDYTEYEILTKETSQCKPAKDLLSRLFQVKRFLTIEDREQIMQKVLYCKSLELENSVNR